jgi:hypothetical protein
MSIKIDVLLKDLDEVVKCLLIISDREQLFGALPVSLDPSIALINSLNSP